MSLRWNWDFPTSSLASECVPSHPPGTKGGGGGGCACTRRRDRGWRNYNSDDWRKNLALCLLCAYTWRQRLPPALAGERCPCWWGRGPALGSGSQNRRSPPCSRPETGYSQTTCYTENQVFCFELFTVAHLFGFHPNTWISKHLVFFTAVWRIFFHLFFVYFYIVLKFCIISYLLISTV